MKFNTPAGIWSIKGEQDVARELYNVNLTSNNEIVRYYFGVSTNIYNDNNNKEDEPVHKTVPVVSTQTSAEMSILHHRNQLKRKSEHICTSSAPMNMIQFMHCTSPKELRNRHLL